MQIAPIKMEMPEPEAEAEPVAPKQSSTFAFIAVILILTGLGVGFGGLLGLQLSSKMDTPTSSKAEARPGQNAGPAQALKGRYPAGANLLSLPPIITNLASPGGTWIRLAASLIVDGEQTAEASVLTAQITEDIVAFLRTVSLVQIQGASGFQHLREDLNDRVRVRSGGKVRDLVIQSLIVE